MMSGLTERGIGSILWKTISRKKICVLVRRLALIKCSFQLKKVFPICEELLYKSPEIQKKAKLSIDLLRTPRAKRKKGKKKSLLNEL